MTTSTPLGLDTGMLFRLLVESVKDYAIFVLDVEGNVATWNPGAERIKGYKAEEIIGQHFSRFYTADAVERRWPWEELRIAAAEGRFEDEGWRLRKDGSRFWANVVITALHQNGQLIGFAKVTRDLSERGRVLELEKAKQAIQELLTLEREARAEAERVGRMKDEFLATLSHELRTPLNAIIGWTHILQQSSGQSEHYRKGLDTIARNAQAQAQLVSDLLDMSSILSGQMRLEVQRLRFSDVVQSVLEGFAPAANAKQVRLEAVIDRSEGRIAGDPRRLQQVVWNLISNAVKFTPAQGKVQVLLERIDAHMQLTVSDTGIGISPAFLPHVFERFSQAENSIRRRFGGLGLGLSLVKQLVELHGGTVAVDSAGQDKGASFVVRLPLVLGQEERTDRTHQSANGPTTGWDEGLPDIAGISVLVVDDDADSCALMREALAMRKAEVTVANTGVEALRLLESSHHDVVLSDIGLPEMDGIELMKSIRARGIDIPAAAITAYVRPDERRRALLAGFNTHLGKPVDLAEVVIVVASLAGRTPATATSERKS